MKNTAVYSLKLIAGIVVATVSFSFSQLLASGDSAPNGACEDITSTALDPCRSSSSNPAAGGGSTHSSNGMCVTKPNLDSTGMGVDIDCDYGSVKLGAEASE